MQRRNLAGQVAAISTARFGLNTGFRMVYLFLPALARGLQVDPQAIINAVAARSALGLGAPVLGSLGDSRGRKTAMLVGLGVCALGCAVLSARPGYATFVLATLAISLSRIIFDPSGLAYLSDRVAYERRGLVFGLGELAWSGAFLLGVPVVGWLMERAGWLTPFPWLAAFSLVCGLWLWRALAPDSEDAKRPSLGAGFRFVLASRSALAMLAVGLLLTVANESVGVVLGLWLETSFGLQLAALGAASAVIGLAELAGDGLVFGLVDRAGKRRSVAVGILGSILAAVALPLLGGSLVGALLGLFLFYLMFEFTMVARLPLITEQVPQARATLLATNLAASSLGRSLGALASGPLFRLGLLANAGAAAGLNLLALAMLLLLVREHAGPQLSRPAPASRATAGEPHLQE
jgi:predicted MFS family arabinose efflux permease